MAYINGQTYWPFDASEDVVADTQDISAGLWSGGAGTLLTCYTSSVQTASCGHYYIDVYNVATSSTTTTPEVQFSVAYGHKWNSGSLDLNAQYPARAVYSQYRNILLEPTDEYFTIGGVNREQIVVVNFTLDRIKQTLDPGNWQLTVRGNATGSKYYTFIDDSGQTQSASTGRAGRIFNIVSGSIASGTGSNGQTVGLAYPDMGLLIFSTEALKTATDCPVSASGANTFFDTANKFLTAVSASMQQPFGFIARNSENIASTHYFCRVKNAAFNFTNNPTFTTGSLGDLYWQSMVKNPTVYFTTIGLYNDNNELLAVAKTSQPIKKTFSSEALVRVKLDFG